VFSHFHGFMGQGTEAAAMAAVVVGEVGVVNGAVVPIVGVPLRQDAVHVMAVNMWGQASMALVSHL
jgi:hypothetical protein